MEGALSSEIKKMKKGDNLYQAVFSIYKEQGVEEARKFMEARGVPLSEISYFFQSVGICKDAYLQKVIDETKTNSKPEMLSLPPLPIKYCGICGRVLIQTPIGTYYNSDSGEKYNHWRFACPAYRWWKFWDRYHSSWRCDETGSSYSYES